MAIFHAVSPTGAAKAEWVHWLFVHAERAISCSFDVRADATYAVTLVPLWSPDDQIREIFLNSTDAVQWLQNMTQHLHAAGWRLVEAGVVTHAA